MSELTQCNFCSLKAILDSAIADKKKVTILPEDFGLGGKGVYVHPAKVRIDKLKPNQKKKYHTAWLMEVSTRCVC